MLKTASLTSVRFPSKRIAFIALLALGTSLSSISSASAQLGAGGQPPAPGQSQQGQNPQDQNDNEVQQILAKYGQFSRHEKYGDVWKPTQVAQGWRPYEPCHWVYNQEMKSWYFDDKTEWGNIVHHYGRWTLDQQEGWLWVPGSEFGPGWVSWEMRGNEVGWAPLPPEQDAAMIESAAFKSNPNLWTFVALESLGKGCGAGAAPPPPPQQRAMAPFMPAPMPVAAPMPAVGGGYVSGGGGGIYLPPRIVIVHGCHSNPRWCNWHPHWNPRPHPHPWPHPRPGDHAGCKAAWCLPGHQNGPKPGGNNNPHPDQKCGIFGQFCKPGQQAGNNGPHKPGIGHRPSCHAMNAACRPDLFGKGRHFPTRIVHLTPHFPNRFVNHGPRFNQRFVMHQPRFTPRPMHIQHRSFTPSRSFAPHMGGGMRMGGGGGMRFAGGGARRR